MNLPPLPPRDDRTDEERGLISLRDYLAAAALTGLTHPEDGQAGPLRMELVCTMAYRWADAMLRERERREPKILNSGEYGPGWHAAAPNLDAAPAATAESDEDRTDKAATSHRPDRPGDTPVAESATPERLRPDFERPK